MRIFSQTACFDWSGAVGARHHGIALAVCKGGAAPRLISAPHPSGKWSRQDALDWLRQKAAQKADILIGMDVSFGFPFADENAYFPAWDASPASASELWASVDMLCADEPHYGAHNFLNHPYIASHFRQTGALGAHYGADKAGRLRVSERASRKQNLANPYSCLNLVGASQVGKASLTAMRLLNELRGVTPVWPFDPVPKQGPLLIEIYTAIAAVHAGQSKGRSKIRDATALNLALAAFNLPPSGLTGAVTDHDADALITAAWLQSAQKDQRYWSPDAEADILATEGWTFGVR